MNQNNPVKNGEIITKMIAIRDSLELPEIINLCDIVINSVNITRETLLNLLEEDEIIDYILEISQISQNVKHQEFDVFINNNSKYKMLYLEDWKDEKYNLILLLVAFNFINEYNLRKIIGNQSKKTYRDGTVINDNSLSLKKFFSPDYRDYRTQFYKNLELLIKLISKLGVSVESVEHAVYSMIDIIQSDIICREKYNNGEYYDYKTRISDIVETRNKEDMIFNYLNKIVYQELINDPLHEPLRFLIFNSWSETKEKYTWITELITFINNNSEDSKDYLINNVGIDKFDGTDYTTKWKVIENVATKLKLNMVFKKQIVKYIFSMGAFYKHRTYNKWYTKEYNALMTFEKHKEFELEETLTNITNQLGVSSETLEETNPIKDLLSLMSSYYLTLMNKFN